MISLVLAAALQTAVPQMSEKAIARALAKAKPVATCRIGEDCDRKWRRASKWVHDNSRFTLVRDDETAILTYPAIYANTDASFAVVLDEPVEGVRTIRFRAWCGNIIACMPSPGALRLMFTQALADASAPAE
jgi:hypothetical protein